MAQRVVKDCFGSEELSKDKDIFRYELKLLQCIEFNINHIQNPIPVSVSEQLTFLCFLYAYYFLIFDFWDV